MILAQSIAFVRDTGIVISWLFVCFVLFTGYGFSLDLIILKNREKREIYTPPPAAATYRIARPSP